ncbi:putative orfan [Tupanvirus soda lake]|uniref:Orfan n=2 Tax=Tupanvirus TaxID=2094720 RepID=A0AC62ADL4_9VIRU|nr:putative orfan [Tupanvirus soda lake]QKU35745.1 putative orfan [Tupanvirus soda lake]
MNIVQIAWIIIATIASTSVNFTIKNYVLTKKTIFIVISLLLYLVIFMAYVEIMNKYPMSWLLPLAFASLIFVSISGALFYNEKLKPINIVGMIIGIFSMFLVVR